MSRFIRAHSRMLEFEWLRNFDASSASLRFCAAMSPEYERIPECPLHRRARLSSRLQSQNRELRECLRALGSRDSRNLERGLRLHLGGIPRIWEPFPRYSLLEDYHIAVGVGKALSILEVRRPKFVKPVGRISERGRVS